MPSLTLPLMILTVTERFSVCVIFHFYPCGVRENLVTYLYDDVHEIDNAFL